MAAASSSITVDSSFGKVDPHRLSTGSLLDRTRNSSETAVLERCFDAQDDPQIGGITPNKTWMSHRVNDFSIAHPKTYSRISKVVLWIRGPRPKVDLPPPKSLLDIEFTSRGRKVSLPLETMLVRVTRPMRKPWLFALLAIGYIIGLAFLSRDNSFPDSDGVFLGCVGTFWAPGNQCGLNGQLCFPLNTSSTLDFRCPAGCENAILQNPRTVGSEQVAFVPLVIGGGDEERTYRPDSFICAAAQHSGIITNARGGCGRLQFIGEYANFLPSVSNGLESLGFPTVFPLAYRFSKDSDIHQCSDLRYAALGLNAAVTLVIFLILQPKALVLYWSLVCIGFWHIGLFSDPAGARPSPERLFGLFLPMLFIAYVFWRMAFRHTLPAMMKAPIEACFLYGVPYWVGVLNNLTFDRLPLSRLTPSDIAQRPGGLATFIILILLILGCSINQLRVMRKTGWLPFYLMWYIAGAFVLLILALLPTLTLRLHHYIIPMILLPATGFPTRVSAIYQGLLLGLFLHGVARWGFASIVQTATSLRRDATLGSSLPTFLTNSTTFNSTIPIVNQTISWEAILPDDQWEGFSLLIDDVERYVGTALEFSLEALDANFPHFFRLAYNSDALLGDYTKAAILYPNGTWADPAPGASY